MLDNYVYSNMLFFTQLGWLVLIKVIFCEQIIINV